MHRSTTVTGLVDWDAGQVHPLPHVRASRARLATPVYDAATSSIFKCDNCDGAPECADVLPHQGARVRGRHRQVQARKKAFAAKFKDAFQYAR